jgi:hypothetical protein
VAGLGTVYLAVEAVRRLLPVVGPAAPGQLIVDGARHEVEVAVQQVDALAVDREPRTAVDPLAPDADVGDDRIRRVVEAPGDLADGADIERTVGSVAQAEVDI